jgi:hypothetical protein
MIGASMKSKIFAIESLSHFKKAVEIMPNKILKYKGIILLISVKNRVILVLDYLKYNVTQSYVIKM